MAQRRLQKSGTIAEYDNIIMMQLVLKGLGSVSGTAASKTLEQAIIGYHEEY